ncbi:MAG: thioesterase family protein [Pseudolabrys sp.]|jgi:acyl-CoA thioester hydrolase
MQNADYPSWTFDTIRYGDTDKQGHVNNAVFSTFLETGRTHFLLSTDRPMHEPGTIFVIARLELDFKAEMLWPGQAHIGTRVKSIGRSSFVMEQAIFQDGQCTATALTVMVMMNEATRKSQPLSEITIARLKQAQVSS